MGDVMAGIVLKSMDVCPKVRDFSSTVMLTVFDDALLPKSFALANSLRLQPSGGGLPVGWKITETV
jgi:hypothetical protein